MSVIGGTTPVCHVVPACVIQIFFALLALWQSVFPEDVGHENVFLHLREGDPAQPRAPLLPSPHVHPSYPHPTCTPFALTPSASLLPSPHVHPSCPHPTCTPLALSLRLYTTAALCIPEILSSVGCQGCTILHVRYCVVCCMYIYKY